MKTEWEDAPERIRHKQKRSLSAFILIAVGLIGGILYIADKNGWVTYVKPHTSAPTIIHKPIADIPSTANLPPAQDITEHAVVQNTQPERQTSFSDSNYQPRSTINTIKPPPQRHRAQEKPSRPSGLNGSGHIRLTWDNGGWRGRYRFSNNIINYDDLCRSQKYPRKGSIEYRACRKAAKAYLRDECKAGRTKTTEMRRMYCHAVDAFRH